MGFTLADAFVYFRADSKDLEKGLDSAEKKTGSAAGNMSKMLGGALLGGATIAVGALVGIGTAAFTVSKDTDAAAKAMAASLGILPTEAEKFADVAKRVYGNNFADSVTDAADAVTEVAKQMKLAADDPALKTMTENAIRLRDTFDLDVNESVTAAKTLMDNFGISGQEAFDLIAAGNQKGLNKAGDLVDTINEYSTQFAEGGASATQFFNLLDSGLAGGALGTDKAADAFKEFRVRIQDGSALTAESLEAIGINSELVLGQLASGETTVASVFDLVTQKLGEQTDTTIQMGAGVGLLGTQFEDLGNSAAVGLDLLSGAFNNSTGAIDSLDARYGSFGDMATGIWRRLIVSVTPMTDALLGMVNDAMPAVIGAFDTFDAKVGPVMEGVSGTIGSVVGAVQGFFGKFATSIDNDATGPLVYWQEWTSTNLPLVQTLFDNILSAIQGFWALFGDDIMYIVENTFSVAFTIIDTTMKTIGDVVTLALQLLTGDWEAAGGTLEGIVTRIWETIKTVVGTQLDSLKTLFTSINWGAVGSAIVESVKNGISTGWDTLLQWFPDRLQELRDMLPFSEPMDSNSPLYGLGKSGQSLIGNIQAGAEEGMSSLNAAFTGGLAQLAVSVTPQAATAVGPFYITVSGNDANAYETGRNVARGVGDEMRAKGY